MNEKTKNQIINLLKELSGMKKSIEEDSGDGEFDSFLLYDVISSDIPSSVEIDNLIKELEIGG